MERDVYKLSVFKIRVEVDKQCNIFSFLHLRSLPHLPGFLMSTAEDRRQGAALGTGLSQQRHLNSTCFNTHSQVVP